MSEKKITTDLLNYRVIEPNSLTIDSKLIILLHGFGASMNDIVPVASYLANKGHLCICPNGPIKLEVFDGGYAWGEFVNNSVKLSLESIDRLQRFLFEIVPSHNIENLRVILAGFSQGGMISCYAGITIRNLVDGIVVLSSPFIKELNNVDFGKVNIGTPIFLAHGINDLVVPITDARQMKDKLVEKGYEVNYKEYSLEHSISPNVVDDVLNWLDVKIN